MIRPSLELMKTALFVITVLSACLCGAAFSQDSELPPKMLSWEELAKLTRLAGLQAKKQDELKVDVMFIKQKLVYRLGAEIELTPAEWDHFAKGGHSFDGLPPWERVEMPDDKVWELIRFCLSADSKVDVSKIPAKTKHFFLLDIESGGNRIYIWVPNQDGKTGSLFFFYYNLMPKG